MKNPHHQKAIEVLLTLLATAAFEASAADEFCKRQGNKCLEITKEFERGVTANGVYFVLRPDGAGCFGPYQGALDCRANAFDKTKPYDRPWTVSCFVEDQDRVCTGSDSHSAKLKVSARDGWSIGIGHRNYEGAPVRLLPKGGRMEEIAAEDGWVARRRFASVFQMLTNPSRGKVEWVEEQMVEHGPKWWGGATNAKTMETVFAYLPMLVKDETRWERRVNPAPDAANSAEAVAWAMSCYSLRLGQSLSEAAAVLGTPDSFADEMVDSAGVPARTVSWGNSKMSCIAEFAPTLTRFKVLDVQNYVKASDGKAARGK